MYDICCIGHITLDKIATPQTVNYLPGGTAYYFSQAIRNLPVSYQLVTSLAGKEMDIVATLQSQGIQVKAWPSRHTLYFENIYTHDQNHRTQKVTQQADPFTPEQLAGLNAKIYHLGPLLAGDISIEIIQLLAQKGMVSLDAQGYLREVKHESVFTTDWAGKKEALPYISILKVNETEMKALTGHTTVHDAANELWNWGVKEIVITLGSMGSVICRDGQFHPIPPYSPKTITDATGCGDTYMAGYLYKSITGNSIEEAGRFASAMAALKIESSGPFTGNEADVIRMQTTH